MNTDQSLLPATASVLTLITIKRGELTHLSYALLLHLLAHPNSCCRSLPLFLMDPDSKHVWAVQLPLGWMYQIPSAVWETLNPEGIPRTRKSSSASLTTPARSLWDPTPSSWPPLTWCTFMVLWSIVYLSIQWCITPHVRTENASSVTSEKLNWSNTLQCLLLKLGHRQDSGV